MRYRVTPSAPPKVAGRRVAAGDILNLTEPEARHELLAGHLEAAEEDASKGAQSASKAAKKD